jgi:hypothetical protein
VPSARLPSGGARALQYRLARCGSGRYGADVPGPPPQGRDVNAELRNATQAPGSSHRGPCSPGRRAEGSRSPPRNRRRIPLGAPSTPFRSPQIGLQGLSAAWVTINHALGPVWQRWLLRRRSFNAPEVLAYDIAAGPRQTMLTRLGLNRRRPVVDRDVPSRLHLKRGVMRHDRPRLRSPSPRCLNWPHSAETD